MSTFCLSLRANAQDWPLRGPHLGSLCDCKVLFPAHALGRSLRNMEDTSVYYIHASAQGMTKRSSRNDAVVRPIG